jgi:hypothetical protein
MIFDFEVKSHHIAADGISDLDDTVGSFDHPGTTLMLGMMHHRFAVQTP